ncbi:helix-hairpin-helix domain-containing protein [Candidatus Kaiserbacteria bacterium]|nr:MAG: helix-hairpin-helix domain-containing protein [Candidatus Kaiserbacteria bacterium]
MAITSTNVVLRALLTSALLFCVSLYTFSPVLLFAAHGDGELININTADSELLDTLDGIGPSRAQDIIDYRTNNGLFATIEDISNVSGIGEPGSSSYEKIKDHITVDESADTSSTTTTTQSQASGTTITNVTQFQYESVTIQPPEDVYIRVPETLTTVAGSFTPFEFESYDATGAVVEDGNVSWAFGDGATANGRDVGHSFMYEGTYIVHILLELGALSDTKTITVTVLPLDASLVISEKGEWVAIANHSTTPLNVSNWRLTTDSQYFIIPEGTYIQSGAEVRFPTQITKLSRLSGTQRAFLKYPNDEVALDSATQNEDVAVSLATTTALTETMQEATPTDASVGVASQTGGSSGATVIGYPLVSIETYTPKQDVQESVEPEKEITQNASSSQAAAIILSEPVQTGGSALYWYIALGAMLLFAIVGVLLIRPRKLVVEGYEVIEVKE